MFQRMNVPIYEPSFTKADSSQEVEDVDIIEIVPRIREIGQTGIMLIDFDPPSAQVPDHWEQYFNRTNWASFTESERAEVENFVSRLFQVIFVKNSDEQP